MPFLSFSGNLLQDALIIIFKNVLILLRTHKTHLNFGLERSSPLSSSLFPDQQQGDNPWLTKYKDTFLPKGHLNSHDQLWWARSNYLLFNILNHGRLVAFISCFATRLLWIEKIGVLIIFSALNDKISLLYACANFHWLYRSCFS